MTLQEKLKILEYFTITFTYLTINTSTNTCIGIKTKYKFGFDYLILTNTYMQILIVFQGGPRDNFICQVGGKGGGGYFTRLNVALKQDSKFLAIIHVHLVFCDFRSLSIEARIMYPRHFMRQV